MILGLTSATIDWLALNRYQNRMADTTGLVIPQAEFWQKMIDGAHRRYMAGIRTLVRVRRCALPKLAQFITAHWGPQQVNVQGKTASSG